MKTGTRILAADSIKGLSADHGPWFGPLPKDLEANTQSPKRRRSFQNQNGCSGGVNSLRLWVLVAINVPAVRPENAVESTNLPVEPSSPQMC